VVGAQDAAEGLGKLGEEGMNEIGDDEADGISSSAGEAASHHVGLIVQLLHALEDAFACFFADICIAAQDLGDGDDGDTKIARDVFKTDSHRIPKQDEARGQDVSCRAIKCSSNTPFIMNG